MKYKIVFSIPVHEKFEVVLDQVSNFLYFNPGCAIVFHLSLGFNYQGSLLSKDKFLHYADNIGSVYINPESVRTGAADIIQAHLSNFKYINSIIDFEYFAHCSSNELFYKEGLYNSILEYDCGLEFLEVFSKENSEWVPGLKSQKDYELNSYLKQRGYTAIYGSHIEGSFYKKGLYAEIVKEIESFYDYLKMPYAYPREEIYFASVVSVMKESGRVLKIKENGLFSWSRWHSLLDLKVWSWDINRLKEKEDVYSLKRVNRDINANLRMYMRKHLGYAEIVKKYVPEATEKSDFKTYFSEVVDFSIEFCRMIYRRIRRVYWRYSGYYQTV